MSRIVSTKRRIVLGSSISLLVSLTGQGSAWADDDPPQAPETSPSRATTPEPTPPAPASPAAPAPTPAPTPVAPTLTVAPAKPFSVDPLADTAVIAVSTGFAGLLDLIITTGEIRPQQISSTFQTDHLLGIDRAAVTQKVDPNASGLSNIGIGVALAYPLVDSIFSGVRESNATAGLIDGVLYVETLTLTLAVTNLAKVAVRRPRPLAYTAAQEHKDDPNYSNADTDSSLSFFSGHTSVSAAMTATATYLAFVRSPRSARPWITLFAGTALTTFVGYERVRAGKHFPTDVIAGAMAGAGIGTLVPYLHRTEHDRERAYWIGATPMSTDKIVGGVVTLSGAF